MDLSYFLSTNCRHYDAAILAISVFAFVTLRVRLETRRAGMRALDAEPGKSPFASPRVGTQRTFYGAVTAPRANKSDHHKCEIVRGQELLGHPR
ncbi:MAG: hypothetical protein DMG41_32415 [Acidobacteria bacterium]|nr:MAG: hypothetical protein AUH13_00725 [Acidobacteria bacterium 13_2_20CM_58_27]PYT82789.1 MAG: hypothetical protein DMG41_32415 [Acidobacteriota bacterium]